MKIRAIVLVATAMALVQGCDVFVGNADLGREMEPCFGNGSCVDSYYLKCVRSVGVCVPSCVAAVDEVYGNGCALVSPEGSLIDENDALESCEHSLENSVRCGCFLEFSDWLRCLSEGRYGPDSYFGPSCSGACKSYFDALSRCKKLNRCEYGQ